MTGYIPMQWQDKGFQDKKRVSLFLRRRKTILTALILLTMLLMMVAPSTLLKRSSPVLPPLSSSSRHKILIFISSDDDLFPTRGEAVLRTWMDYANNQHPELNVRVVMALNEDSKYKERAKRSFPHILVPKTSYDDLYIKIFHALATVYEQYPDYDYYMKADDDLFIHIDRLAEQFQKSRPLLDPHHTNEFLGFNYNYMCWGGPGYIFSRQALKDLYPYLLNTCIKDYAKPEDMAVTECARDTYPLVYKDTKTWPGCKPIPGTDRAQFLHLSVGGEDAEVWKTWNGDTSKEFRTYFARPDHGLYSFDKAITIHPIKQEQHLESIPNMDQLYARSAMSARRSLFF